MARGDSAIARRWSSNDHREPHCSLSVVMPVYNEEDAIVAAVEEVQRHVLDHVPGSELVVVNDGSRDRTGPLLDGAAAKDRARARDPSEEHAGTAARVMAALGAARGEYVFLLDSDRQIPLDDFPKAWREIAAGHDAVFGVRRRRHDPALRLYLTAAGPRRRVGCCSACGSTTPTCRTSCCASRSGTRHAARADGTLAPSLFLAIIAKRARLRHRRDRRRRTKSAILVKCRFAG